jgi:hypothetical protein
LYALRPRSLAHAAAFMRGRRLTAVMAIARDCEPCALEARAVESQLRRIGIQINVKEYADPRAAADEPGAAIDLLVGRTLLDYPDSASFVVQVFRSDIPHRWLGADVRRAIERVARLSGNERQTAAASLADRLVKEQLSIIAWGNLVQGEFFSPTLGCRVFPPTGYGVDLAALCRR